MCTLSMIPLKRRGLCRSGLRVVMNRDERPDRPEALPPRWRTVDAPGGAHAIWPTDPQGGGTWIAASNAGLVLCLLNLNLDLPPPQPAALQSRGLIIPRLVGDRADPVASLKRTPLESFAPFRLVVADFGAGVHPRIRLARWDGRALSVVVFAGVPLCLVSSGLGDSKVEQRLDLFRQTVEAEPTPEAQDQFHLHAWPDRPELSVLMSRAQARTVSITTVEMQPFGSDCSVRMNYQPVPASVQLAKSPPRRAAPVVLLGREG
jgi:uncharacterized protein with NRDE domain